MQKLIHLSLLFFVLILVSCSSRSRMVHLKNDEITASTDQQNNFAQEIDLATHLRSVGGVNVKGSGMNAVISVRSITVSATYQEPLFLVDGNIIRGGYRTVYQMVTPSEIKNITVARDGTMYGTEGVAGAILIDLK